MSELRSQYRDQQRLAEDTCDNCGGRFSLDPKEFFSACHCKKDAPKRKGMWTGPYPPPPPPGQATDEPLGQRYPMIQPKGGGGAWTVGCPHTNGDSCRCIAELPVANLVKPKPQPWVLGDNDPAWQAILRFCKRVWRWLRN